MIVVVERVRALSYWLTICPILGTQDEGGGGGEEEQGVPSLPKVVDREPLN